MSSIFSAVSSVYGYVSRLGSQTLQYAYRGLRNGGRMVIRKGNFIESASITTVSTTYNWLGAPSLTLLFGSCMLWLQFGEAILNFIGEFFIFVVILLVKGMVTPPEKGTCSGSYSVFKGVSFVISTIVLLLSGIVFMVFIVVRWVIKHIFKIMLFLLLVGLFIYFAGRNLQDLVDFAQSTSHIVQDGINLGIASVRTANEGFKLYAPMHNKAIRNAGILSVTIYETLSGEVVGTGPNVNGQLLFPSDDPLLTGRRLERAPLYTEDTRETIDRIIATGLKIDEVMFVLTVTVIEVIGDLGLVSIIEKLSDVFELLVTKFVCMIAGKYCGIAEIFDTILNDVLGFVFRQIIGWISFLFTGEFLSIRIDVSCGEAALAARKITESCLGCVFCIEPKGFYQHAPLANRDNRRLLAVSCEMVYGLYQESVNDQLHSQSYSMNDSCPLTKQSMHAFGNALNLELFNHHDCYNVKVDGLLVEVCPDGQKRILGSYGKKDHDLDSAVRHLSGHLGIELDHAEFTNSINQTPAKEEKKQEENNRRQLRLTKRVMFEKLREDTPKELVFSDGTRYTIKTTGNFWDYAENAFYIGNYIYERNGKDLFPDAKQFQERFESSFSSGNDESEESRHLSAMDLIGKMKHRRRKLTYSEGHMSPMDRISMLVGVTPSDYDDELQGFIGRMKRRSQHMKRLNEKRRKLQAEEPPPKDKREDVIRRRILSINTCQDQQFKCDGIEPLLCVDNVDECPAENKLKRILPLASYYINQGTKQINNLDFADVIVNEIRCFKDLKENPDLDCSSIQNIGKTDEASYDNCFMCAGMQKPYYGEIPDVQWSLQSVVSATCTSDTDFNSCVCPNFYALSKAVQLSEFGYITQDFWYTFLNGILWVRYLFARFVPFWSTVGSVTSSLCGDEVCTKSVSYALIGPPTDMTVGELDACFIIHTGSFASVMAFLYLFLVPLSMAFLWYFFFAYGLLTEVVFTRQLFCDRYGKYHDMKKRGVPLVDIQKQMIKDGKDPNTVLDDKPKFDSEKFVRKHFGVFDVQHNPQSA